MCANVGQIINRKSILTEWLIDRMTERVNFFDILWRDKTCFKNCRKRMFFFIIQLSKHSVGLLKLEFQQNMLNISKKVESKPKKLEKLMYNGKFSNLKLHFWIKLFIIIVFYQLTNNFHQFPFKKLELYSLIHLMWKLTKKIYSL